MFHTLKHSLITALQQWRIVLSVYILQLCLALTVGLEVQNVLEASIGNSLSVNQLLKNYDHTVISDFLQIHGASISPLMGQLKWLIVLYVIFAVFIDAGLLLSGEKGNEANIPYFLQKSIAYFFPFLKIFLIFLLLVTIWTAVIFVPIFSYLQTALEIYPNESYTIFAFIILIIIYLIGISFLFLWAILSRFSYIKNESGIFTSMKTAWLLLYKNKRKYYTLLLFILSLQIIFLLVYWTLSEWISTASFVGILLLFLIQQIFIFSRIFLRQSLYIGINHLYK